MTLEFSLKVWSVPLCLSLALSAGAAQGQQLLPENEGAAPLVAVTSGETDAAEEAEPVVPTPIPDVEPGEEAPASEPAALEPQPLPAEEAVEPQDPVVTPEPAEPEMPTTEVVEERFANGALKIAREVVQDSAGNYLNHGSWKMFNEQGALIVEGQYYEDQRHGIWNRWYAAGEVPMLRERPFTEFTPPFVSQGIFDSGDLHGAWLIYDAKQRKICEIRFTHGERDGRATWYHPNGRPLRQMHFEKGVVTGEVVESAADGKIVKRDRYDAGRKHTTQTIHFSGDVKKFSGEFLEPELTAKNLDNWWKGELATYTSTGKPIKHGGYTAWHGNGQTRMKGEYQYDMPVGQFTWWYANGQKSLEGDYTEGKQDGEWSWWHENGQRSIRGFFTAGNPSGKWTWWNKEGKVAQSGDFSDERGAIVVTQPIATEKQAEAPTEAKPMKR